MKSNLKILIPHEITFTRSTARPSPDECRCASPVGKSRSPPEGRPGATGTAEEMSRFPAGVANDLFPDRNRTGLLLDDLHIDGQLDHVAHHDRREVGPNQIGR